MSDYDWYDDDDYHDEPAIVVQRQSSGIGTLFLGIALGAAVALVFAPQSGAETRRLIKRSGRRAKDAALDVADDVTSAVSEKVQCVRESVESRIESARDTVGIKKRQISNAVAAGRAAAREARVELEYRIAESKAASKE